MFDQINYYLHPKINPSQDWDAVLIHNTYQLTQPLRNCKDFFLTIGGFGGAIGGSMIALKKFKGSLISSTLIYCEITFVALLAIGFYFNHLIGKHFLGLTDDKRVEIGLDALKQSFEKLTICKDKKRTE